MIDKSLNENLLEIVKFINRFNDRIDMVSIDYSNIDCDYVDCEVEVKDKSLPSSIYFVKFVFVINDKNNVIVEINNDFFYINEIHFGESTLSEFLKYVESIESVSDLESLLWNGE